METLKKVYFTASKVEDQVYKVCKALGALAMSIAFLAIFLQVIYRYILCRYIIEMMGFACGEIKPFESVGQGGVE